jgi:hypothetical protein
MVVGLLVTTFSPLPHAPETSLLVSLVVLSLSLSSLREFLCGNLLLLRLSRPLPCILPPRSLLLEPLRLLLPPSSLPKPRLNQLGIHTEHCHVASAIECVVLQKYNWRLLLLLQRAKIERPVLSLEIGHSILCLPSRSIGVFVVVNHFVGNVESSLYRCPVLVLSGQNAFICLLWAILRLALLPAAQLALLLALLLIRLRPSMWPLLLSRLPLLLPNNTVDRPVLKVLLLGTVLSPLRPIASPGGPAKAAGVRGPPPDCPGGGSGGSGIARGRCPAEPLASVPVRHGLRRRRHAARVRGASPARPDIGGSRVRAPAPGPSSAAIGGAAGVGAGLPAVVQGRIAVADMWTGHVVGLLVKVRVPLAIGARHVPHVGGLVFARRTLQGSVLIGGGENGWSAGVALGIGWFWLITGNDAGESSKPRLWQGVLRARGRRGGLERGVELAAGWLWLIPGFAGRIKVNRGPVEVKGHPGYVGGCGLLENSRGKAAAVGVIRVDGVFGGCYRKPWQGWARVELIGCIFLLGSKRKRTSLRVESRPLSILCASPKKKPMESPLRIRDMDDGWTIVKDTN